MQIPGSLRAPRPGGAVRRALLCAIGFGAVLGAPAARAHDLDPAVYHAVAAASLEIIVDGHLAGSGVVVDPAGWALTAGHAVIGAHGKVEVRSAVLARTVVEVTALDRGHDLALLRLPRRDMPYVAAPLADALPPVGTQVFLIGAPLFRHEVLFSGHVARDGLTFEYRPDQGHYMQVALLAAASPLGTSGGPWFDRSGHVIGIQSGYIRDGNVPVGVAQIGPTRAVRALATRRTRAQTPSIGVALEELWEHPADVVARYPAGAQGTLIVRLSPDGPAERAGVRPMDLVTHVDDAPVTLRDEVLGAIWRRPPGAMVRLRLWRPGDGARDVTLTTISLEGG